MEILETPFVQRFIKFCLEGYGRGWHERNGGNFSYRMKEEEVALVKDKLVYTEDWKPIGTEVPSLAEEYFLVKCTGSYMMNMGVDPLHCLGIIQVDKTGTKYRILFGMSDGRRPTSELPAHLMNLAVVKERTNGKYRVVYHCHPATIIALSFVLPLDAKVWSHRFWEMMTECPIIFPAGIGVVPWMVPGGKEIAVATSELMKTYDIAIWAHHGIFVTGEDFDSTWGLIDCVEKSADILCKVLAMGGIKQTITDENFHELEKPFGIKINPEFLD